VDEAGSLSKAGAGSGHRRRWSWLGGDLLTIGILVARRCEGRRQLQIALLRRARILAVSGEAFAQARYATDAAAAEALSRAAGATIVLAPGTRAWCARLPGVAYRLGGFIDTHATALGGAEAVEVTRWFYRQRMEAVLTRTRVPWLVLLDPGTRAAFGAVHMARRRSKPVAVELPALRTTVTGFRAPRQDEQTIRPDAKLLFVAGAGWTKKQPDGQVHAAEAEQADSRLPARDQGVAGRQQVAGGSQRRGRGRAALHDAHEPDRPDRRHAAPSKGLSTCCHGEEPHVVGWRFINRAARHQPRPQLRLGARQGRRALHRRRLSR
jgi:electron transfer flavoprotein alpha subunit